MIISFRFLLLKSFKWSIKYYLELIRNEIIKSLFEKSEKFVYPKIQNTIRKKEFGSLDKEVFSEFDWLIFFLYAKLYPNLYPNLGKLPLKEIVASNLILILDRGRCDYPD